MGLTMRSVTNSVLLSCFSVLNLANAADVAPPVAPIAQPKQANVAIDGLIKIALGPTNDVTGPTIDSRLSAIDSIGQLGKNSTNASELLQGLMRDLINEHNGKAKEAAKTAGDAATEADTAAKAAEKAKTDVAVAKAAAEKEEANARTAAELAKSDSKAASQKYQDVIRLKGQLETSEQELEKAEADAAATAQKLNQAKATDPDYQQLQLAKEKAANTRDQARQKLKDILKSVTIAEKERIAAADKAVASGKVAADTINAASNELSKFADAVEDVSVTKAAADAKAAKAAAAKDKVKKVSEKNERPLLAIHTVTALGSLGKNGLNAIPDIVQAGDIDQSLAPYVKKAIQEIQNDLKQAADLNKSITDLGTKVDALGTSVGKIPDLVKSIDSLTAEIKKIVPKPTP